MKSSCDTLIIFPSDTIITLKNKYIIKESIKTISLKYPLNIDTLSINPHKGEISGFCASDTNRIIIKYNYFNIDLPIQNILNPFPETYLPEKNTIDKSGKTMIAKKKNRQTSSDLDFLKSGTLYRGVTMGSENGMSLQSGLNLELQGNLAKDITIAGALSDKNIPIQPEGNTQTLNEIDKVYIKLGMKHENIIFGDYELSMSEGKYGFYERKLQGIYSESNRGFNKTILGGAVSKGQFNTNKIIGSEGNQGPYQLTGKNGETAIIVLAGTEKVWINGEQLKRGENNEYIIDYSTGEINFMAKQLITTDSRITVDFQYSDLIYQKNIWYAKSKSTFFNDKVQISAGIINESDDKENPIELTLDANDKIYLKNIGDDENKAYQSTIVEDSIGAYLYQDSILIFIGAGLGTHSAFFYNIGQNGEYRKIYDGNNIYFEWIDKFDPSTPKNHIEEARYLPAKPMKLPKDQRLYHISGEISPFQKLKIRTELAQSVMDNNTFSNIDDENNKGNAFALDVEWKSGESKLGQISLTNSINQESKTFSPIDRNHEIEFKRKWNLESDSTQGSKVFESALNYNFNQNFTCQISTGSFEMDDFNSNRYKVHTTLNYKILKHSEFFQEYTRSSTANLNQYWLRRKGSMSFDIYNLSPYSKVYYEKKETEDEEMDFKFLEQTYGLESQKNEKIKWRVEQHFRKDENKTITWNDEAKSNFFKFNGQIINWKTISSEWTYTHRSKEYLDNNAIPNINFSLMSLLIKQNPEKFPISWESSMKIEKERTVKKEKQYFYVGEGKGEFLYDSTFADYIPHAQGDYILRILPSNIKTPVTNLENGIRLRFTGNKLQTNLFKNLTSLTDIRLKQEIKSNNDVLGKWTYSPSEVDTSWAYFFRTITQNIRYRIPSIRGYIQFRYRNSNRKSQLDVRGSENSLLDEYSLQYRGPLIKKLTINSEMKFNSIKRESFINSLRDRNIFSIKNKNKLTYLIDRINHIILNITVSQDKQDDLTNTSAQLIGIRPEYEKKIKNKGRWKIFLEYNNVGVTPVNTPIPWEMCNGKREGSTFGWGGSIEYRIGKHLSIRGNYEGWNEPDRDIYHIGSMEVRALF